MLMNAARDVLLMVDVQEKLAPVMDDPRRVLVNGQRLIKGAGLVGVPVLISEQYPKGLGPTMVDLRELAPTDAFVEKTTFSCAGEPTILRRLEALGRPGVVIAGIEAHVCVTQTALDLHRMGYATRVVRDAVSARQPASETAALERLARAGVDLVTVEMVLFEWLGDARHPAFKEMQKLIK